MPLTLNVGVSRKLGLPEYSSLAASGNGNGHPGQRRTGGRSATASQARALRSIADRQRIDLSAELRSQFGVEQSEELSIAEASQLIDSLKASTNGRGPRR